MYALGETFRATGRYVWPLFYVVLVIALWIIAQRLDRRAASALFAIAAAMQIVDTSPGWRRIADATTVTGGRMTTTMTSPFWQAAAARFSKVRIGPPQTDPPRYAEIAYFAISNGLDTDAVHIARGNPAAEQDLRRRLSQAQQTGRWPEDTLYILDDAEAEASAATLDRSDDLLAEVDGFYVLAPGWPGCAECPQLPQWAPTR